MAKNKMQILGMMSGTSLDGLDMALCEFEESGQGWSYHILKTGFRAYDENMCSELETAIKASGKELLRLHQTYGRWLGNQARDFLDKDGDRPEAIASHGHTIHHRPEEGFTFQLGCPQQIALVTHIKTVGDFRSLDVALGGQGAPLVPAGDRLLFDTYDFCLNLGGICNVSFEENGTRIAFDIGIANMLLNHLCKPLGLPYDREGKLASIGRLNPELLSALDSLPYYTRTYPKSTGYEWFRDAIMPLLDQMPDRTENLLHTAVHHITGQISRQLQELSAHKGGNVLVTGGGALNTYLMEVLQGQLGPSSRLCGKLFVVARGRCLWVAGLWFSLITGGWGCPTLFFLLNQPSSMPSNSPP
ncbi:MAG: anhydro-N-acetylmuramic acid kinase [Robiginitalea sp.]